MAISFGEIKNTYGMTSWPSPISPAPNYEKPDLEIICDQSNPGNEIILECSRILQFHFGFYLWPIDEFYLLKILS
jgi:hypothetical protein